MKQGERRHEADRTEAGSRESGDGKRTERRREADRAET